MLGTLTLPAGAVVCSSTEMIPCSFVTADRRIPAAGRRFSKQKCKAGVTCAFATVEPATEMRTKAGSLYEVLRVKRTASPTEIKSAYRSLAKMYHPDAVQSDGRDFMEIHNAYETLSDPAARAVYDLSLGAQHQRRPFAYTTRSRAGFYPFQKWETDQCW